MSILNKEHFRTIRKAIESNKLAIFVGSAVSYDSNLPAWGDLIDLMKSSLESPRTNDYLKIAEHYYLQYGRNTYYSKINEFFPSESQPNLLHELILKLKPQHIITTNWDDLLEKSIASTGDLYFKVATDHELASSPSSQLLVKMHGDLSHRNIVFKESDYLSYADKFPLIENFIKSLFSTHVVLFIGYSISDYNLNQVLSWIRNRTQDAPPSFTILTEAKITLSESNYLREKGVYALLRSDEIASTRSYFGLSPKSIGVAKILDEITRPDSSEIIDILSEMEADISSWTIVYPSVFIQLLKDRLNITKINKAYYDSSKNAIIYGLDTDEARCSRDRLREIRKKILKFLHHIPVTGVYLSISHEKYYRIRNPSSFEFSDEYTTFNFGLVGNRISSANLSLNSRLDDSYQFAFDNYYLKRLSIARDSYMHIANRYFSKSLFVKSLISSFNKKQLCFGEIPWEDNDNFMEVSMEEQLSRNDNISEIIDKFPKSIVSRQKALFHGLDANNSFLLERFKNIATLSREIDDEIHTIKSGGMVFSSKTASMYNQAYCIVLFVIKNKISVLYSSEYKNIARIAFESIIKRSYLKGDVQVDALLSYLAVISFKEKDLVKFLSDNLNNNNSLIASNETIECTLKILENCLYAISSPSPRTITEFCSRAWSNHLIILSHMRHDQSTSNKIIAHLANAFDTNSWPDLSEAINRFLVLQVNRFGVSFSVDGLKFLLDKQVEKINSTRVLPYQERGRLFSNLLYLIEESNDKKGNLFDSNKELEKLITNISLLEFDERLTAINGFIFAIYYLSSKELKNKISDLLSKTFDEAKERDFGELSIIFGLDLYSAGALGKEDLLFTLNKLREKSENHSNNGSASSHYLTIKDQLSKIDAADLQDYKDVVELVTTLSDAIKSRFSPPNKSQ